MIRYKRNLVISISIILLGILVSSAVASISPTATNADLKIYDYLGYNSVVGPATAEKGATATFEGVLWYSGGNDGFIWDIEYAFYLSGDADYTTPGDNVHVETFSLGASSYMEFGQTLTKTETVTIPADMTAGTYYIIMVIDPNDKVPETINSNNWDNSVDTISITNPPLLPDIDPTSFSLTASSGSINGGTIPFSYTWSNIGDAAITNTIYYHLQLYTTGSVYIDDIPGSLTLSGTYAAGYNSPTLSFSVNVPDVPAGTYRIGLIMDELGGTGYIVEKNEANNVILASSTFTITSPWDLSFTNLVTSGTPVDAGSSFTVTPTIYNGGTSSISSYSIKVYLSTDNVITTSDTLIRTYSGSNLGSLATNSPSLPCTVPSYVTPGSYYVGVIADPDEGINESNESNNKRVTTGTITVDSPYDAVANSVSVTGSTFNAGASITINPSITNGGSVTWNNLLYRVYLSTDPTVTTSDINIGEYTITSLASGASHTTSRSFTIPIDLTTGSYYLGIIVDPTASVGESNESNNVATASAITINAVADLQVDSVGTGPNTLYVPGETITLDVQIQNYGALSAGSFDVSLYASTDTTITTADTLLAVEPVVSLSGTTTLSITFDMAELEGYFYFGAIIDSGSSVAEGNESNNAKSSASSVGIGYNDNNQEFATADLIAPGALSGTLNGTTDKNDYFMFEVTENQRINLTFTGTTGVRMYLYSGDYSPLGSDFSTPDLEIIYISSANGTYYVRFELEGAATGDFTGYLELVIVEDNETFETADTLGEGEFSGTLAADDTDDYFKIYLEAGTYVNVTLVLDSPFSMYIYIKLVDDTPLSWSTITAGSQIRLIYLTKTAGDFRIQLHHSSSDSVSYDGTLYLSPDDNWNIWTAPSFPGNDETYSVSPVDLDDYYDIGSLEVGDTVDLSFNATFSLYFALHYISGGNQYLIDSITDAEGTFSHTVLNSGQYYLRFNNYASIFIVYNVYLSITKPTEPGSSINSAITFSGSPSGSFPGPAENGGVWYIMDISGYSNQIVYSFDVTVSSGSATLNIYEDANTQIMVVDDEDDYFFPDGDIYYLLLLPSNAGSTASYTITRKSNYPGDSMGLAIDLSSGPVETRGTDRWFFLDVKEGEVWQIGIEIDGFMDLTFDLDLFNADGDLIDTVSLTIDYVYQSGYEKFTAGITGRLFINALLSGGSVSYTITATLDSEAPTDTEDTGDSDLNPLPVFSLVPVFSMLVLIAIVIPRMRKKQ